MSIVKEHISFERGLDAKAALNVGKRVQLENWFKDIEQQIGQKIYYTINDDLSIYIKFRLNLNNNNITELPDNLTINASLDLNNNNIYELPNNLIVAGDLFIRNTKINKLPVDLKVSGKIYKDF